MSEPFTVRLTKFVETPTYRHRFQRTLELPFAPFPGLILFGYCAIDVVDMTVEKVIWNGKDKVFDCILIPRKAEGRLDLEYLYRYYGCEWKFDGVPLVPGEPK